MTARVTGSQNEEIRYENLRIWKGEDGEYLILTILGEQGSPPAVFERLYVAAPDAETITYIVRNVEYDMRSDQATVSCLNEAAWLRINRHIPAAWLRINRHIPRPPKFRTEQEADQWLERYAPR